MLCAGSTRMCQVFAKKNRRLQNKILLPSLTFASYMFWYYINACLYQCHCKFTSIIYLFWGYYFGAIFLRVKRELQIGQWPVPYIHVQSASQLNPPPPPDESPFSLVVEACYCVTSCVHALVSRSFNR